MWKAEVNITKQMKNIKKIHEYIENLLGKKFKLGYDYFLNKHKYLLKFYDECNSNVNIYKENSYLDWVKLYHKLDDVNIKPIYDNYYKECKNISDVVNLSIKFRELFISIKKGLKEIDLTKYKIQLLGIYGGGNRLAILRILNYNTYTIYVNDYSKNIIKNFNIGSLI